MVHFAKEEESAEYTLQNILDLLKVVIFLLYFIIGKKQAYYI